PIRSGHVPSVPCLGPRPVHAAVSRACRGRRAGCSRQPPGRPGRHPRAGRARAVRGPMAMAPTRVRPRVQRGPRAAGRGHAARSTAEWEWRQREYGHEYIDGRWQPGTRMPAVKPTDWERRAAYWDQVLRDLDRIELEQLPGEERINAEVFRAMVETDRNNARW